MASAAPASALQRRKRRVVHDLELYFLIFYQDEQDIQDGIFEGTL